MERFTNVLIDGACFIRPRRFDFPLHAIHNHVCGRGSVFLAAADELHGPRHCERLGRFVFMRPDVEVWRDDDLSPKLFHSDHYTAAKVAETQLARRRRLTLEIYEVANFDVESHCDTVKHTDADVGLAKLDA